MVLLKLNPDELKTRAGSGKIIFIRKNVEKLDEFPQSPLIELIPDLVFIKKTNEDIIKEKAIEGVPELVIEVLSTNREHDLHYKKSLYEPFGVQEYWIVDPVDRSFKIFTFKKENHKYQLASKLNGRDIITSKLLFNFKLRIEGIFPN